MKAVRAGTVGRVDGAPANLVVDDPLRDQEARRRAVGEPPGIAAGGAVEPFGPGCWLPDEGHAGGGVVVLVAPAPGGVADLEARAFPAPEPAAIGRAHG